MLLQDLDRNCPFQSEVLRRMFWAACCQRGGLVQLVIHHLPGNLQLAPQVRAVLVSRMLSCLFLAVLPAAPSGMCSNPSGLPSPLGSGGGDEERLNLGDKPTGWQLLSEHIQGRSLCLFTVPRLCQLLPEVDVRSTSKSETLFLGCLGLVFSGTWVGPGGSFVIGTVDALLSI